MTDKSKQEAHNDTMCAKTTTSRKLAVSRLAKRRKQTVSKTINELVDLGLSAIRKPRGSEQGVIPPVRVNPSEK